MYGINSTKLVPFLAKEDAHVALLLGERPLTVGMPARVGTVAAVAECNTHAKANQAQQPAAVTYKPKHR